TRSRLVVYETNGHQSARTVSLITPEAMLLTNQSPSHMAITYREFRDKAENASIINPAETTTTTLNPSDATRSRARSRTTVGSRPNAHPNTNAHSTGPIVTAARSTPMTPSLPRKYSNRRKGRDR